MEVTKDIVFFPFNRAKRQLGLTPNYAHSLKNSNCCFSKLLLQSAWLSFPS